MGEVSWVEKKRLKGFDILKTTFKPKNSPFHVVKKSEINYVTMSRAHNDETHHVIYPIPIKSTEHL